MFTPSTNLRLLNVPLEAGYSDTLWFPDVNTQTQYFLGKVVKTINDFNFIKKDNTITINGNVETYYNCNYIMYQNANFSNKWFYAFIDRVEWASNSSTRLYCSTDCIQTWFFDITYYQSFIERQHSTTDTAGDNIVPEPFNAPMVKFNTGTSSIIDLEPNQINIFATCMPDGASMNGEKVNGVYSGAGRIGAAIDPDTVSNILKQYVDNGLASAVSRIQQVPSVLASGTIARGYAKRPSSLDGYTPVNKKMLTGLFVRDSVNAYGQQIKLNPELVDGNDVSVRLSVGMSTGDIAVTVANYGSALSGEQTIVAHVPESTWAYNQYKNEYNLHSASNSMLVERLNQQRRIERTASLGDAISTGAGVAGSIVGSIASGNLVGGAHNAANVVNVARRLGIVQQYAGGFDEISQALQSMQESYNAPEVGNVASGSPFITGGYTSFVFGYITPPYQLAYIYDRYLTIYGYQQNNYFVPNLHARKTWTYIKVQDLRASGAFPDEDMSEIRSAFNKGIFFWDYSKIFGDFSQDNTL